MAADTCSKPRALTSTWYAHVVLANKKNFVDWTMRPRCAHLLALYGPLPLKTPPAASHRRLQPVEIAPE